MNSGNLIFADRTSSATGPTLVWGDYTPSSSRDSQSFPLLTSNGYSIIGGAGVAVGGTIPTIRKSFVSDNAVRSNVSFVSCM